MTKALYSFNFVGGGFNAVWACSKQEAIHKADAEFGDWQADEKTFVRRDTKELQNAYWNSLPLMD